jgi:hypothetical protein
MATAKRDETLHEKLLALIPEDATRVKVHDEKTHERWRDITEGHDTILPSDNIVVVSGQPVTMKGKPGRKKKAPLPKAPPPVNQTVANLVAQKQAFFDADPLLRQIDAGVESEDILHFVMHGFGQEAASLQFERIEAERNGRETSQLSIRRINALKALGETWIKRKEQLAGKTIDLDSPAFVKLFEFMLETFRESMLQGNVPRDQAESVFARLSDRMDDETWEQEARNRMKGA